MFTYVLNAPFESTIKRNQPFERAHLHMCHSLWKEMCTRIGQWIWELRQTNQTLEGMQRINIITNVHIQIAFVCVCFFSNLGFLRYTQK